MKIRFVLFSLLLTLSIVTSAHAESIYDRYSHALMTNNIADLENILAPDYYHITANGYSMTRDIYLSNLKNKIIVVKNVKIIAKKIKTYGAITIVHGTADFDTEIRKHEQPVVHLVGQMRFTMGWSTTAEGQKIHFVQMTPQSKE